MATSARVRLSFEPDTEKPRVFERDVDLGELREDGGREFVAQRLFSELEKDSHYIEYRSALPSIDSFLRPVKQTFRGLEMVSDTFDDRLNTREMWLEIGNTLLRVHHLLPKSRTYHDAELTHCGSQDPQAENLSAVFHLDKMANFDLVTILLQKIHDLAARLVFERLGASLLGDLDQSDPEWERFITPGKVRKALSNRARNPQVAALSDDEYSTLLNVLDELRKSDDGTKLQSYRNKFVHRIAPSVDRTDLYGHLQDRRKTPIVGEDSKVKGWTKGFGGRPATPQYVFLELYDSAVQTLSDYVDTLKRLEAMPRFGPEATDGSAAASA
jgi:hypothetical protein